MVSLSIGFGLVNSMASLTQIEGSLSFDTLTYKPVNDLTNKTTATKAGKVVMTGTITVAKNGKSRVVRLTGTDANGQKFTDMTYYDKQQ
jgi:hypothetical protein